MNQKFRFILFGLLLISSIASGFQWPVEEKILTATFGESRWDHYHTGIDIGGGSQIVRPVEDGEVIFMFDGSGRDGAPPSGLGTFVVIEHERRIRTLYAHLEPGSLATIGAEVSDETEIGVIGDSGASLGKHLHLEVIDSELGTYINPLLVLPNLEDTITPEIRGAQLIRQGGTIDEPAIDLVPGSTIPTGNYRLLVELFDRSEHVAYFCPMAPYRISGFLNGSEAFSIELSELEEESGTLVLGTPIQIAPNSEEKPHFDALYHDEWIVNAGVLPFRVGEIQLEIVAEDIVGNETTYRVAVSVE